MTVSKINADIRSENYTSAIDRPRKLPNRNSLSIQAKIEQIVAEIAVIQNRKKELYEKIRSGKTNIIILSSDLFFYTGILRYFDILLSKTLGQDLVQKLLKCKQTIIIQQSNTCTYEVSPKPPFRHWVKLDLNMTWPHIQDGIACRNRNIFCFIHELCHINNFISGTWNFNKSIPDKKWMDREEKDACTGRSYDHQGIAFPYNIFNENNFRRLFQFPERTRY